jgi:hypothetical protein
MMRSSYRGSSRAYISSRLTQRDRTARGLKISTNQRHSADSIVPLLRADKSLGAVPDWYSVLSEQSRQSSNERSISGGV